MQCNKPLVIGVSQENAHDRRKENTRYSYYNLKVKDIYLIYKYEAGIYTTVMKILVIGCGIAGLTAAIKAWQAGLEVEIITKTDDPRISASRFAQGGIAVRGQGDNSTLFRKDILRASDRLALPEAAALIAEKGPETAISFLVDTIGVPFAQKDGALLYTEEAAHSNKRILYSGDETGAIIISSLLSFIKKTTIKIRTHAMAVELITIPHHSNKPLDVYKQSRCCGAYVFFSKKRRVEKIFADKVILATGGVGRIYRNTTNPYSSTGDGIAMAYRAGCRIVNMEYTQFHPTTLAVKGAENFLISEAVRGEGAVIINAKGNDFTRSYDPRGSLASRDVVARAIIQEMEKSNTDHVFLSLEKIDVKKIAERFPNIYTTCKAFKIDIRKEPIPVVPAFHFSCGGVLTDLHGHTSLPNLFAIGENACTGVHGANRLASVSLLEGVFFAHQAIQVIKDSVHEDFVLKKTDCHSIRNWQDKGLEDYLDPVLLKQDWDTLKSTMWNYVGIIRTKKRLSRAREALIALQTEADAFYRNQKLNVDLIELRNAIQTAIIITNSALKNPKSRGCHYIADHRRS